MKNITYMLASFAAAVATCVSCSGYLDPIPDGNYNEDNWSDYPKIIRGYIDKAYNLLPNTYCTNEFMGTDAATDDAVWREASNAFRAFLMGQSQPSSHPLASVWSRDYEGIYYVNLFLKDNIGLNTRYLVDESTDKLLRNALQGDAYGMRAWYMYDLLKTFGGRSTSGELLGVPIIDDAVSIDEMDPSSLRRASYAECVEHILADCDSAAKYLPHANRSFLTNETQSTPVLGSVRYGMLDGVAVTAIKAMTWLLYASPAINTLDDVSRYERAAELLAEVIDYKLNEESAKSGFTTSTGFLWSDCNSPEVVWLGRMTDSQGYETYLYPQMFGGTAKIAPSQDLVDAFPMANGYPIDRVESGYDPSNPYAGRDPRFYSAIHYNGSAVVSSGITQYTFETWAGGKDAPGGTQTSPTGYYVKKFLYNRWNPNATTIETAQRAVFLIRWSHICLMFAEAANNSVGPLDSGRYGYSAREVLGWLRSRQTNDGVSGIGARGEDPYLDECALAGAEVFDTLVKNEWRVETCFEGKRFWNLRRWNTPVEELNATVHEASLTKNADGTISYTLDNVAEIRKYPSLWFPLPYKEMRMAPELFQNEGWESWK